jgi:hypothetical protein
MANRRQHSFVPSPQELGAQHLPTFDEDYIMHEAWKDQNAWWKEKGQLSPAPMSGSVATTDNKAPVITLTAAPLSSLSESLFANPFLQPALLSPSSCPESGSDGSKSLFTW